MAGGKGFGCDPEGYLRHWLIVGPHVVGYEGPAGDDDRLRAEAIDATIVEPPRDVALGARGPFGEAWRFYAPGANIFVEQSAFYASLARLDLYAATDVHVPAEARLPARLWAAGTADLWAGGAHLCRHHVPRYMYPEARELTLPLRAGANRLCVRLQGFGVRDTRLLFGLQFLRATGRLRACLPGPPELTDELAAAEGWLNAVRLRGRDALRADGPAPAPATVRIGEVERPWPAGEEEFRFDPGEAFSILLAVELAGQRIERLFEIPANRPAPAPPRRSLGEHRREHLRRIAGGQGTDKRNVCQVIARRLLGRRAERDGAVLDAALRAIDAREDCADFSLAMLLRLVGLGLVGGPHRERIRQACLRFRYWPDEAGSDAMCFSSENHALLFHGCQWIAGRLFPDDPFVASGRSGREQAVVGRGRCAEWIDRVEREGFREFLSSAYAPITTAALMNLVDFCGDEELSRRAGELADAIFAALAAHSFDGVTVGPQGRVYRSVLYPQSGGTQAMLSYAVPQAAAADSDWVVFVASSPTYEPPADLRERMESPVTTRRRQGDMEIELEKTAAYLLTSLRIPASFDDAAAAAARPPGGLGILRPGVPGYQQHLWQATLGRDCHVFVNHPGASFDLSSSRPGYWYGNGVLPRLTQRDGMLLEIFDIPGDHPIGFTHAHWPSDALDRQEVREHWAFGAKGAGLIALWCSRPLEPYSEVLTDRELRAAGRRAAWLCLCRGADEAGEFASFIRHCLAMRPAFEADKLILRLAGRPALHWKGPADAVEA